MRVNNRNSIARIIKFPRFTTMNVIDGQAGLIICASLFFYSLTIDNILNIIVLLILVAVTISTLTGENGILAQAGNAKIKNEIAEEKEKIKLAWNATMIDTLGGTVTAEKLKAELIANGETGVEVIGTDTLTITMSSGNQYKMIKEGKIEEAISDIELLEKYLLGSDKSGVNIFTIFAEDGFIGNEVIENADEELIIQSIAENSYGFYIAFLYNDVTYKVYLNDELTTTKVEKYEEKIIYEGNVVLTEQATFIEVTEQIQEFRVYDFWLELDGQLTCLTCEPSYFIALSSKLYHAVWESKYPMIYLLDGLDSNNNLNVGVMLFCKFDGVSEVVLKKIVDTETDSDKFVRKNGFTAICNDERTGCTISFTPDEEYVIPDTVGGLPVEKVYLDGLRGSATFTKAVEVGLYTDPMMNVDKITITCADADFITDICDYYAGTVSMIIDVSQAGDDIELPSNVLGVTSLTVYVNETVKAKYQDYDNIVVKTD